LKGNSLREVQLEGNLAKELPTSYFGWVPFVIKRNGITLRNYLRWEEWGGAYFRGLQIGIKE